MQPIQCMIRSMFTPRNIVKKHSKNKFFAIINAYYFTGNHEIINDL